MINFTHQTVAYQILGFVGGGGGSAALSVCVNNFGSVEFWPWPQLTFETCSQSIQRHLGQGGWWRPDRGVNSITDAFRQQN